MEHVDGTRCYRQFRDGHLCPSRHENYPKDRIGNLRLVHAKARENPLHPSNYPGGGVANATASIRAAS